MSQHDLSAPSLCPCTLLNLLLAPCDDKDLSLFTQWLVELDNYGHSLSALFKKRTLNLLQSLVLSPVNDVLDVFAELHVICGLLKQETIYVVIKLIMLP